jgi:uncharacterized protein YodC (DUF2158 family)
VNVGNVVQLISGGPNMTVTIVGWKGGTVGIGWVQADWFWDGIHYTQAFPIGAVASVIEAPKQ